MPPGKLWGTCPGMQGLKYAVDPNPISHYYGPMRLYHKMDVRERAIQKHGSIEAMLAVMMPEVQV